MLDKNLLEETLVKISRVRITIIIVSIVLTIAGFVLRDYFDWGWCDYCLFLLPYVSTTLYCFHKQILFKKEMFITNEQEPRTKEQIELSTLDCLIVIIKYLKL